MLILIYLPILVLAVYSFTPSDQLGKWQGFSFQLYTDLFNNKALMNAKQMYDENISDLEQENNIIKIVDPDYLLSDIVDELIYRYSHLNKQN